MDFIFERHDGEYEFEYDVPYEVYDKVLDYYTEKEYVELCETVWNTYREDTKKFIAEQLPEVVISMNPITIDWVKAREIDDVREYIYHELIVADAEHLIEDDVRDEVIDDAEEEFKYALANGDYEDPNEDIIRWFETQRG